MTTLYLDNVTKVYDGAEERAVDTVTMHIEDGEIVAQGTHAELLDVSPLYREIVEKGMPDQVFINRNPLEAQVAGL